MLELSDGTKSFNTVVGQAVQGQQAAYDAWVRYLQVERPLGKPSAASARVTADFAHWIPATPTGAQAVVQRPSDMAERTMVAAITADLAVVDSDNVAWLAAASRAQADDADMYRILVLLAGLAAAVAIVAGNTLLSRAGARRQQQVKKRDDELSVAVATNEFEARLQRALDLSSTEARVHRVMEKALVEALPDVAVELLVADSSRAHFHQVLVTGDLGHRRCSVESPVDCPAAQRGGVLTFDSSVAFDACPYLQDQTEPCSAVCVPVNVSDTTVGVVHAAGAEYERTSAQKLTELELIARRASDRIGMLRAFAKSETQANMDPLTGLPNRRSLEDRVHRLERAGTPYAVAFGDLDRFKMLNDVHGHATGDRALRLFSQVLRDALRPDDLVGRYGGEEFVIVLPGCNAAEASEILLRVRAGLLAAVAESDVPAFTVSFGLTDARPGVTFEALVSIADAALLEAKAEGRNRVVVAGRPFEPDPALEAEPDVGGRRQSERR
jgi:diguanylate cyclase (GGDEF)-like protein